MSVIKLVGFTGESPRTTPRLLPQMSAQIASSTRLEDGELSAFRKPYLIEDMTGQDLRTIYLHDGEWLHWSGVVHAVPGPVAADRLYYTGDGAPKMRVAGNIYDLKLAAPSAALTATPVGVTAALYETRLYAYTFVTDYGEESEPSPVSAGVNVSAGQNVTLSGFQAPPAGRNFTKQRIYRSQTGASGTTRLYFVAERAAASADYLDAVGLADFNEPLPSDDWNPPPDDLKCLTALPNGMMVGISGKQLCFSVPFIVHAWPEKYRLTMDYEGVALAAQGTSIVVGTAGSPYVVSGTHPESMVMEKMELNLPCLSARGMVDLGYAAAYPSHDGLVVFQGGRAEVVSEKLFTRDQWLMMNPEQMVAAQFYGRYFASFEYVSEGGAAKAGTLLIDLASAEPFLIRTPHKADAMFYDMTSGKLYMAISSSIFEWDSQNATADVYTWKSKLFITPQPTSFGVIQFEADQREDEGAAALAAEAERAAAQASNEAALTDGLLFGAIGAAMINEYAANGDALTRITAQAVAVNVYADGKFLYSVTVPGKAHRLPARSAKQWEVEVTGTVAVQQVTLAGSGQELRSI